MKIELYILKIRRKTRQRNESTANRT